MSSPSSSSSLVRVLGVVQSYEWGKIGRSSSVGELGELGSNLKLDAAKPYAELWMGTHCNGPAKVQLKDGNDEKTITLSEHLGGKDLPFLFKILSVGKSLSIQAHPDMTLAQQLHSTRGNIYKDPFHKPELACALTPFETMCAFRPIEQIRQNIADYPEFAAMLGHETVALLQESCEVSPDAKKSALRAMFTAMMTPSEETLKTQLNALLIRLKTAGVQPSVPACDAPTAPTQPTTPLEIGPLMMRLAQQYPGDVGIFAPLYLNAFAMRPGEAIFLGPNEPHAYLSGDCVECMACSDNVVRAGLTPKLRDTEVLINMLTYATHTIESVRMKSQESGNTRIFAPSKEFSEFRLLITELPAESETTLPTLQGASLLLNWIGECQLSTSQSSSSSSLPLTRGQIVCVPNEAQVKVKTGASKVTLFQCAANTQ